MAFIPDVRMQEEIRRTHEKLASSIRSHKIENENMRNLLDVQFEEMSRERAKLWEDHDHGRQESDHEIEIDSYSGRETNSCNKLQENPIMSNEEEISRVLKLRRLYSGPMLWRSVLCSARGSGDEEIKKARARLVLKVHPDKNKQEVAGQAGEAIKMVLEAYEGLTAIS